MEKYLVMIHQRNFYTEKIYKALNLLPIVVLIGARQVGKTTILQNLDLNGEKLFLNGQNPEINEIFQKYSTLEAYLKINMNSDLNGFLLIDEFQYIHGISTMLKLLADNCNNLKILCTGSSSLDILQEEAFRQSLFVIWSGKDKSSSSNWINICRKREIIDLY